MSDDLARDVLVHWALPLLARARYAADHHADPMATPLSWETWEVLAEDIAALIGHGVTDQPPADELAEVLAGADLPPVRRVPAGASRLGTPGHFHQAREIARSAARRETTEAPAAAPDPQALHDRPAHTLAACPTDGAPCIRWCPGRQRCADQAKASMSRESAPRTPPEAFGPRADRCPTCGHRP